MQTLITWVARINLGTLPQSASAFWQQCANRLVVGRARYGNVNTGQQFLTKLKKELRAYEKSGNQEYLKNIANYAFLESLCPEHENSHFVKSTTSATRTWRDNQI